MLQFLINRWFLVSLVTLIPLGLSVGWSLPQRELLHFSEHYAGTISRLIVAFVLFLMSVTLDIQKFTAALKAPGVVIWACLVNFAALPLLAIPLSHLQLSTDFAVGLVIAACVPSTMASASVWTRKAGGNDAVSLLGTIITNGFCFIITPFWLSMSLGDIIKLETSEMVERLVVTALIPIAVGQMMRSLQQLRQRADEHKPTLGNVAQICILILVFWASIKGGSKLSSSDATAFTISALSVIWVTCLILHVAGLCLAFYGGRLLRFSREDIVAAVFSGSQKTLPIGIYIATDLLAGRNLPFAAFPILIFHVTQLILDTLLIEPLKKWSDTSP